jgi:hypothetical protein
MVGVTKQEAYDVLSKSKLELLLPVNNTTGGNTMALKAKFYT